jgi:hypothetical protein
MAGFPSQETAEETIEKLENELRQSVSFPLYRKVIKDIAIIFSLQLYWPILLERIKLRKDGIRRSFHKP